MDMNKHVTRLTALALALALMLPLAACGGGKAGGQDEPTVSTTTPTETAGPTGPSEPPAEPPAETAAPAVDPEDAVRNYWKPEQLTQAWGPNQVVEHLFFHPVIAYPEFAFTSPTISADQKKGLDDFMVTADEYVKILESLYAKGYILVNMDEVWSEYTNEQGQTRMQRNTLMLPEGKKPLVFSFDDVNYYDYMLAEGFMSKLILGADGDIWAYGVNPFTGEETINKDLDATTILDEFVREHPDFSLNGAKGCFSLTGFQGILGYRTQNDIDIGPNDPARPAFDAKRQSEIDAVKPIVQRLKDTGWTFGCHTWGHIRLPKQSMASLQKDVLRWQDEVGSLVGPTNIIFYPFGGRPDGDKDQGESYGEQFKWLQSIGYRVFASVGINSYSQIKTGISAVICDRLHPDGTTLRGAKSLERYSQFYDAREIIDLSVRPNYGVGW